MATRRDIYVSPTGDDIRGEGTRRRPFRTIERARWLIRWQGWNLNMSADLPVHIAPGTYWDVGTAMFREADSGSNGHFVVYQVDGDPGDAQLLGGKRIDPSSWINVSGSVYKTPLPLRVHTMWENGVRGRKARLPKWNPGSDFPCAFAPYFTAVGDADSPTLLAYDPGDFDASGWTLADVSVVGFSRWLNSHTDWFTDTHLLTAINTSTHKLSLDNGGWRFFSTSGVVGTRYFAQGDLSMLTDPGEFAWHDGFLYYSARDGAITDQEIVVPTCKDVLALKGNSDSARVTHVRFDGLAIQYTDFDGWYRFGGHPPSDDTYGRQRQNPNVRHGLVSLENTDNIRITNCHLKNSGFAGVYLREYGQQNTIRDSWIEHTGTSAIYVEGRGPDEGDIIGGNTYWDLKLNNFGELAADGEGIHINQSGNNVCRYMLIENGPRYGMELTGWNHDPLPQPGTNYTDGNQVSYIRVLSVGQDSGDMGAITCNFFDRTGVNYFDQIIVDGVNPHPSMLDAPGNGVFCDNETGDPDVPGSGQRLSNIQVSNVAGAQFRRNDSGGHVLTNCSFLPDGTANPDFNPALMQTGLIGLTAEFPF